MKSISRITGKFFYTLLFLVPTVVFSEASDYNMPIGVTEPERDVLVRATRQTGLPRDGLLVVAEGRLGSPLRKHRQDRGTIDHLAST
jgi:hypothetical protein